MRIISRLDIKGINLIKSVQLEGLRTLGSPEDFACKYYQEGIDEILLMDAVASLYGRNSLDSLISQIADNVFVPITVGGGIRTLDDARRILRSGADKVAVNTGAVRNPELIKEISETFGSQATVLSIDCKRLGDGWEVLIETGREKTGLNVVEWAKQGVDLGAGELLITSVDNEGTRKGFDVGLMKALFPISEVPIIASGGMGRLEDIEEVSRYTDAIAIADFFHYNRGSIEEIFSYSSSKGIKVRDYAI